jgi:hypothetical protein
MAVVEFLAAEIVGGVEAKAAGAEFLAEFSLLTFETLELGLRCVTARKANNERFEEC